jgi:hypothetical protein
MGHDCFAKALERKLRGSAPRLHERCEIRICNIGETLDGKSLANRTRFHFFDLP